MLLELWSEVRSVPEAIGGCGERADGRAFCDMPEVERDEGNEESEVRRLGAALCAPVPVPAPIIPEPLPAP